MDKIGYLLLVLHAHLPFVRHPEHEDFLEEDWLYEALTETYIPLIEIFDRFLQDGIDFRLTMSVTPPLASMLRDPLLQNRYLRHLDALIELAEREIQRTRWQPEFGRLAQMYYDNFSRARHIFVDRYHRDITSAFKKFQDLGKLDILTCGATHGYLPLMETTRHSVEAQVKTAVDHYTSVFGRPPRGIWLPECGYQPGDDKVLEKYGIRYFFVDTHGILHGSPRPKFGVFAPVYCPSGVAAFGRDLESSKQVWSTQEGYPGEHCYREFYRDIGFDLDFEYVKPYIHPDGIRINTGIKYFRITGPTDHKEPYVPEVAREKAAEHAGNFLFNREKQCEYLHAKLGRRPLVVAPYDAELFGHWWYEGPQWLDFLVRKVVCDSKVVRLITAHEFLKQNPTNQVVTPSFSSWGYKGYSEVWLEGSNDWVYRHLHEAAIRMHELASKYKNANGLMERALKQAAREMLLAESSDWAFIMKTGTVVEYARKRVRDHLLRFTKLYEDIQRGAIDEGWLSDVESKDNIFPDVDFRIYA
jgi:1,4-alpha-glucan branching enzyme